MKDITGQRFGRLLVHAATDERSRGGSIVWKCRCDCGKTKPASSKNLISGNTRSCGCLHHDNGVKQGNKRAPTNIKGWRLRSPENVVFEFKNLSRFVRNHGRFFDPDDVRWILVGKSPRCRATMALASLRPTNVFPRGSWKGWTWHSQTERLKNEGRDLLERQAA